jgi:DNA-binding beta-propeller fold protein YncE
VSVIPVGTIPIGVAITPDRQYAYVLISSLATASSAVAVIDMALALANPASVVKSTFPIAYSTDGTVAFTPDGQYADVAVPRTS